MRPKLALLTLPLCALSTGCQTFYLDIGRNVTELPIRACDDDKLIVRLNHLADDAWVHYQAAPGTHAFSEDFARGFKAGFVSYLYRGGNGQPPATPPFPYTLVRYETVEGHRAILEWYEGYAEGATVAKASGVRELIVIPLSAPPINAVPRRDWGSEMQAAPPVQAPSELPPPRPAGDQSSEVKDQRSEVKDQQE
jgi:hypothetical protein